MPVPNMTTPGGLLLVLAVLVPFTGVLAGLGIALAIGDAARDAHEPIVYLLGGWAPPLGVALRADGLAVAILVVVAVVICGLGVYASCAFGTPAGAREARAPFTYWLLLLAVWGSLNLVFVSGDMFTLYV